MSDPPRGRPRQSDVDERIRAALRVVGDPIALGDMALTTRPAVQFIASTELRGRTCADGLALARVLRHALGEIARDLEGLPVGKLAAALLEGRSQTEAAAELGITDEYLCRRWKRVLLRLVGKRFELMDERARTRLGASTAVVSSNGVEQMHAAVSDRPPVRRLS